MTGTNSNPKILNFPAEFTRRLGFYGGTLVLLAALGLPACTGSPFWISYKSPEKLKEVADLDLCHAYRFALDHNTNLQNVAAEINRRGLLTEDEWTDIRFQKIRKGMSLCGLYAAWGPPLAFSRVSAPPGTPDSPHRQFIYRHHTLSTPVYVYTRNGTIQRWENSAE